MHSDSVYTYSRRFKLQDLRVVLALPARQWMLLAPCSPRAEHHHIHPIGHALTVMASSRPHLPNLPYFPHTAPHSSHQHWWQYNKWQLAAATQTHHKIIALSDQAATVVVQVERELDRGI